MSVVSDDVLPFRPRPKVVHVGKYYYPEQGGIENHCYRLCARLARHVGLTVIVSQLYGSR